MAFKKPRPKRRGWMASHPDEQVCPLCGNELADFPLTRTRRGWVHKVCHNREHE